MPQKGESGLTIKTAFKEEVEKFIENNPQLGFSSVPEALRFAWNKFSFEYITLMKSGVNVVRERLEKVQDSQRNE